MEEEKELQNASPAHAHHRERLRARYRFNGTDGFSDHELLELLLCYSIPRKDTNVLAHRLIERFGDLRGVLNAEERLLCEVSGMGETSAFLLTLARGIVTRYYEETCETPDFFTEAEDRIQFFVPRFAGRLNECVYAAFLDQRRRLMKCTLLFSGAPASVQMNDRQVLEAARANMAHAVILAHNHFVSPTPSLQDVTTTGSISALLEEYGIELMDHIIVCGGEGISMRQSGHLALARKEYRKQAEELKG